MSDRCVGILSGGLDSTGAMAYWKNRGYELLLLTFDYGQRASREIERAQELAQRLSSSKHTVIDISFMKELYGASNVLTDSSLRMPSHFQSNIIVPIRNAVFLTIASAYAFSTASDTVVYGAHMSDQPYPDCRPEFAAALAQALNLGDIDAIKAGNHASIKIWSPAIAGLSKPDLLRQSYKLLGEGVYRTWSCYLDGEKQCGVCESCNNRKNAFAEAGIPDKTEYL